MYLDGVDDRGSFIERDTRYTLRGIEILALTLDPIGLE